MKTTPSTSRNELVVLMPARNEAQNLPSAIVAVNDSQNLNGHTMDITVCANACTDDTMEVLEHLQKTNKNLDVITEWVPGKPQALNALVDHTEQNKRMGNEDVVVFLDADAKVGENTLSDLVTMLHKNKKLNMVSANDIAEAPKTGSIMDHLLFGISEISLSSLAIRDRKASCSAVRGKALKGVRFPEHVVADDLWLAMYLGIDSVETHPEAFVTVQAPSTFVEFASKRVKHMMGLYQLEEFFPGHEVKENFSMGTHDHVQAFLAEGELQDQFVELPAVYQFSSVLALPIHAALKAVAWVGHRIMPGKQNHSVPVPRAASTKAQSSSANVF